MNLASSLRPFYASPSAAFVNFPDTKGYAEDPKLDHGKARLPRYGSLTWLTNQQSALKLGPSYQWRIDGATSFGTEFYAVPEFLSNLVPRQITVILPSQIHWPKKLRSSLDATESAHQADSRAADLGIAKYLTTSLSYWAFTSSQWTSRYQSLPFGSTISLQRLEPDVTKCQFTFEPCEDAWSDGCTLSELQDFWHLSRTQLPSIKPVNDLRFVQQINDSVALVQVANDPSQIPLILKAPGTFKSSVYHELKVLLTLPTHKNIAVRPLHLVSIQSEAKNDDVICGFLLPYFRGGSLDEVLPKRRLANSLHLSLRLKWCDDIIQALIHVKSHGQFYSDLKMDNIVVDRTQGVESATLIDFELDRNIFAWSPPEILAVEWVAQLAEDKSLGDQLRQKYSNLINQYLNGRGFSFPLRTKFDRYDNSDFGTYFPWVVSSLEEREAGMVYLLGKTIWCVMEGMGEVSNILGVSSMYENPLEFPSFKKTPVPMQNLIRDCTTGSREWSGLRIGIFRQGGKIYPRSISLEGPNLAATVEETKSSIHQTWQREVNTAEALLEAKIKLDKGLISQRSLQDNDRDLLGYVRRPSLLEVKERLDKFRQSSSLQTIRSHDKRAKGERKAFFNIVDRVLRPRSRYRVSK